MKKLAIAAYLVSVLVTRVSAADVTGVVPKGYGRTLVYMLTETGAEKVLTPRRDFKAGHKAIVVKICGEAIECFSC